MQISQDKKDALQAFLSQLGNPHIVSLVGAMDYARDNEIDDIPYEFILQILRPALYEMRPERFTKAQRIFCDPFEDLLTPADPKMKVDTLIARASIQPIWDWIVKRGGTTFDAATKALQREVEKGEPEAIWEAKNYLWHAASGIMEGPIEDAFEDPKVGKTLIKALGGSHRFDDMVEILHVLRVATEIEQLKENLPVKPITRFTDTHVLAVRDAYELASQNRDGGETWIIVAAMRRLLKPVEILRTIKLLTRDGDDGLFAITDLAKIGDVMIGTVDESVAAIEALASSGGKEDDFLGLVNEYVQAFDAITKNINVRRDGEWGAKLFETRKIVSSALDRAIISQAPTKLATALKQRVVKTGRISKKISDLRADLNPESYRAARASAQSIQNCLKVAQKIGLSSSAQSAATKMVGQLEDFSDQLLEDIHTVPEDYKARAREHVIMVAHLMEFLVDSDQADLFLRRAMSRITGDVAEASE